MPLVVPDTYRNNMVVKRDTCITPTGIHLANGGRDDNGCRNVCLSCGHHMEVNGGKRGSDVPSIKNPKRVNLKKTRVSFANPPPPYKKAQTPTYAISKEMHEVLEKHWHRQEVRRLIALLSILVVTISAYIVIAICEKSGILAYVLCGIGLFISLSSLVIIIVFGHQCLTGVSLTILFTIPICLWASVTFDVDRDALTPGDDPQQDGMFWWPSPYPSNGLPEIMCFLFAAYTLLTLPFFRIPICCGMISLTHILISTLHTHLDIETPQVVAIVSSLVAMNLCGFFLLISGRMQRGEMVDAMNSAIERRCNIQHEKDRQDQLLYSIIPVYMADRVREQIKPRAKDLQPFSAVAPEDATTSSTLFHNMNVDANQIATILFSDIVNFTPLTLQLSAADLVKTLHELFSRFDQLAQQHKCMRIKILGDCWYGVSGIPVCRPGHADNCVELGLSMIDAIKTVRHVTGVNVDMRIGIHSGNVLCGVLGLRKWQFDIWSDDVILSNHLESSGKPGCVHITSETKDLLKGDYNIVDAETERYDSVVIDYGLKTYYIYPFSKSDHDNISVSDINTINDGSQSSINGTLRRNNESLADSRSISSSNLRSRTVPKQVEFWQADVPFANLDRRKSSHDMKTTSLTMIVNSLSQYETVSIRNCFKTSPSPTLEDAQSSINAWTLGFDQRSTEVKFNRVLTPNYAVQVTVVSLVCLLMFIAIITGLIRSALSVSLISLFLMFLFVWCCYVWHRQYLHHTKPTTISAFKMCCISACAVLLIMVISMSALMPLLSCAWFRTPSGSCYSILYVVSSCQLALVCVAIFICLNFPTRLILLNLISIVFVGVLQAHKSFRMPVVYVLGINTTGNDSATSVSDFHHGFNYLQIIVPLVVILYYCWKSEYERRMDFGCLITFEDDETDTEMNQDINTILLSNILPAHVASHFLSMKQSAEELYHENHPTVCVMFASIPNFQALWGEWNVTKKKECLRFLNEIICEFDKLLSKPKFSNVEKIKTVGSTYMAAAGLQSTSKESNRVAGLLVEFSFNMMTLLDRINKDSFQNFQLRVGMSYGSVIAGVIGAQKPQYDIWGNTVNMASRMDSHGQSGRIHVTLEAAEALIKNGYNVESRGHIRVKGVKDEVETFFVVKK